MGQVEIEGSELGLVIIDDGATYTQYGTGLWESTCSLYGSNYILYY